MSSTYQILYQMEIKYCIKYISNDCINCIANIISSVYQVSYQLHIKHCINCVSNIMSSIYQTLYQLHIKHCIKYILSNVSSAHQTLGINCHIKRLLNVFPSLVSSIIYPIRHHRKYHAECKILSGKSSMENGITAHYILSPTIA
jgi:phage-related protein